MQAKIARTGDQTPTGLSFLLERATTFRQGESLVAGLIAPHPAFLRFARRLAQEGGGDVPADWSRPQA